MKHPLSLVCFRLVVVDSLLVNVHGAPDRTRHTSFPAYKFSPSRLSISTNQRRSVNLATPFCTPYPSSPPCLFRAITSRIRFYRRPSTVRRVTSATVAIAATVVTAVTLPTVVTSTAVVAPTTWLLMPSLLRLILCYDASGPLARSIQLRLQISM